MESVRRKVQAMELLLEQVEATELEVVAAQYAYELAASRPQVSSAAQESTKEQGSKAQFMRWKRDQAKTIIPRMIGVHSIEEARDLRYALTAVFNAYTGLKQEYVSKQELLPALRLAARDAVEGGDRLQEIADLETSLQDVKVKLDYFETRARELAERIDLGEEEGRIALV